MSFFVSNCMDTTSLEKRNPAVMKSGSNLQRNASSIYTVKPIYSRHLRLLKKVSAITTISFIIFRYFSMFCQIFFSLMGDYRLIISYKHGIYELTHKLPNNLRLSQVSAIYICLLIKDHVQMVSSADFYEIFHFIKLL